MEQGNNMVHSWVIVLIRKQFGEIDVPVYEDNFLQLVVIWGVWNHWLEQANWHYLQTS